MNSVNDKTPTYKPSPAGKPMSSSLKDRLKRSGRCQSHKTRTKFTTPYRSATTPSTTPNTTPNTTPYTSSRTPQRKQDAQEPNSHVKPSRLFHEKESIREKLDETELNSCLIEDKNKPDKMAKCDSKMKDNEKLDTTNKKETCLISIKKQCTLQEGKESSEKANRKEDLNNYKKQLKQQISANKEKLRKLNLVETYRKKHSIEELECLKGKWKSAAQNALEYLNMNCNQDSSISKIIDYFKIDPNMVSYDKVEEMFTS